jgi:hypothetical protein
VSGGDDLPIRLERKCPNDVVFSGEVRRHLAVAPERPVECAGSGERLDGGRSSQRRGEEKQPREPTAMTPYEGSHASFTVVHRRRRKRRPDAG